MAYENFFEGHYQGDGSVCDFFLKNYLLDPSILSLQCQNHEQPLTVIVNISTPSF